MFLYLLVSRGASSQLIGDVKRRFPAAYERVSSPVAQAHAAGRPLSEQEWFALTSRFGVVTATQPGDAVANVNEVSATAAYDLF